MSYCVRVTDAEKVVHLLGQKDILLLDQLGTHQITAHIQTQ
jgi:hypothetical protein